MSETKINLSFDDVEKIVDNNGGQIREKASRKRTKDDEYSFEIISVLGPVSDKKGAPIVSRVRWGAHIKYDLRKWNEDMTKPYKGITFDDDEIEAIMSIPSVSIDDESDIVAVYSGEKAKATIYHNLITLSKTEKSDGWKKEINIVDWGYGKKIDIRTWKDGYSVCGKGIGITNEEFEKMKSLLRQERELVDG